MARVTVQTGESPQKGDPVKLIGWEGGERGPLLVKYLPGAIPPLMVVWVPGRSGFYDRGRTKYYPATIHVLELTGILEQVPDRPLLWRAVGDELVSFEGSFNRGSKAAPRSY